LAYLAIALLGVVAWLFIPIELLPDTELPRLSVTVTWRGASPEATEAFLTSPLEAAIQQVRCVEKVSSVSEEQNGAGRASIQVEFARGTDMDFARLELSERLAALDEQLPDGASRPVVESYVPEEFREQSRPFLRYTVTGPYTVEALRTHVDSRLAPELRQVDGVAEVQVQGGRARMLEIEVDEEKALALGLRPEDLRERIRSLEYVRQAGVVRAGGTEYTVAIRQRAESAAEVRRLPLMTDRGCLVRLEDVARVRPILMTSAVTILGLLPLVVLSESADANIWNALGYALLGGLASSTVLVLTVTPALYLLFERGPERRNVVGSSLGEPSVPPEVLTFR
jgi:HAE1 family hydrophobic/amphiphilic exporter-1